MSIAAVILAAGRSSRMGRSKALLRHVPSGRSFVAHLIECARQAGVDAVFVVGRPDDREVEEQTRSTNAVFVPNPDAAQGQLNSLIRGLDAAASPELDAILVMPVDVPLVTATTIRRLLEAGAAGAAGDAAIVRASHGGRHGHPVLFRSRVFDELRRADPAVGARAVVHADPSRVRDVEVGDAGVTLDIDTPSDYERAFGRSLREH